MIRHMKAHTHTVPTVNTYTHLQNNNAHTHTTTKKNRG
jgi:hypothetical protein